MDLNQVRLKANDERRKIVVAPFLSLFMEVSLGPILFKATIILNKCHFPIF